MKIIGEQLKERMISASEMPATTLINSYRDSFEIKNNPLSEIYENEILKRLWAGERQRIKNALIDNAMLAT